MARSVTDRSGHTRSRRCVLLLRGVNVGGHRKVPMADLRRLLSGLGHANVRTLLNSGNAVFDLTRATPLAAVAAAVEAALEDAFGFRPRTFVMSAEALDDIVAENILAAAAADPSRMLIACFADPADRKPVASLVKQKWGIEALAVGSRAAYVWCPRGVIDSPAFEAVSRALGDRVTTRNWSTVLKLQAACRER